jgi:hypothetical protein
MFTGCKGILLILISPPSVIPQINLLTMHLFVAEPIEKSHKFDNSKGKKSF